MSSKRAAKAPTKKKTATPAKKAASKVAKKAAASKPVAKKSPGKRTVAKKAAGVKKTVTKKAPAKKAPEKKAPVKKAVSKSAPAISRPQHAPYFDPGIDEGMNPGALPLDEVHDEAEIAQHLQLQEQAEISRKAREMNRPEFHPDFDGKTCVDCGEDIPPARLLLRRVRCVDCQSFLEEESARRRRLQG